MKQNFTKKLVMSLALLMLATSAAWAQITGYSRVYIETNGLVFKRLFTDADPTGSTCVLVKPSPNNKNLYGELNEYGERIGYAEVPEGKDPEIHVGPDGDEYKKESYVIPSAINDIKVVEIAGDAFKGNTHLKSITFPAENLTTVPGAGFYGCTALESLDFTGTSIKVIGTQAFAECTALKEIKGWGNVETIHGNSAGGFGYAAFGGCTALTELKIGPSVKYIYGNTFGGCTSLTKLIFEDGDDWLELSAGGGNEGGAGLMFYDSPITYVYYGRRLTNNAADGYNTFSNPLCSINEEVRKTIPEMTVEFGTKIDSIRSTIFNGMTVPLVISAPGATYIGTYAFQNANVKSIDVPKIKKIDDYAFFGSQITGMNFYSVEEIGIKAFETSHLETATLPKTLKTVGEDAFISNLNDTDEGYLKKLVIEDGDDPIELGFDHNDYESYKDETSYDWTVYAYSSTWLKSNVLEELYIGRPVGHEPKINEYGSTTKFANVLRFDAATFPKLKKVELTKVTMISSEAFFGDYSEDNPQNCLEEVSLPMVTVIPSHCFKYCTKLKTVDIPKAKTLWDEAFAYTSADLDISFINTVDSVKAECFAHSGISGELTIPGTVKYLGRAVFNDCENLKKVTFEYGEKPLGMEYSWTASYASSGMMTIGGNKCGIEEFYFDRNVEPSTYTDGYGDTHTYRFEIAISDGSYGSMGFPNLKSATIGKKLTSLDGYSFQSSGLEFIRCENPEPIDLTYTTYEDDESSNADHSQGPSFSSTVQKEVKLLVPDGSVSDYLAADVWKGFLNLTDSKGDLGSIAITVPAEGSTTYSGLRNLDFSKLTDIKAYIVTSYDADAETVELSPVTAVTTFDYIETGVVIKGKAGTYQVPVAPATSMSAYLNMLASVPTSKITLAKEGYTYYNYSSSSTYTYNCYLRDGDFVKSNGIVKVGPNAAYLEIKKDFNTYLDTEPVTVDVKLGSSAFTPLCPEVDLDFTDVEGLTAYCATGFTNSGTVMLTRVNKVPAYTTVLLKGTAGATYTVPSKMLKAVCMNMLQMNRDESDLTIEEETYSLANFYLDGDKFKKVKTSATIAPGEAYLNVPSIAVAEDGPDEFAVVLHETETMNILSSLESEPVTISAAEQVPYYSDQNLDFSDMPNLKAYVATGYDKATGTIWLTRVKQVPANTGFLLMGEAGDYEVPVADEATNCYYKNMFKGTISGETIYTTDGDYTNYYLSNGDYGVGFYKVGSSVALKANRAYLSIPTDIPAAGSEGDTEVIKVGSALQVPYFTSKNLDFSTMEAQGVKAYTATGYNYKTGTIWLSRVKQVPAQTGVLVMADAAGEYDVPTASVASVYANMFVGSESAQTIYENEMIDGVDYVNYYLSNGDYGVGFYRAKADGVKLGVNRCYLQVPYRATSGARGESRYTAPVWNDTIINDDVIGIPVYGGTDGNGDGTTTIQSSIFNVQSSDVYYNLQGQRVDRPGKGLYIKNGEKILIK